MKQELFRQTAKDSPHDFSIRYDPDAVQRWAIRYRGGEHQYETLGACVRYGITRGWIAVDDVHIVTAGAYMNYLFYVDYLELCKLHNDEPRKDLKLCIMPFPCQSERMEVT